MEEEEEENEEELFPSIKRILPAVLDYFDHILCWPHNKYYYYNSQLIIYNLRPTWNVVKSINNNRDIRNIVINSVMINSNRDITANDTHTHRSEGFWEQLLNLWPPSILVLHSVCLLLFTGAVMCLMKDMMWPKPGGGGPEWTEVFGVRLGEFSSSFRNQCSEPMCSLILNYLCSQVWPGVIS